jgi:hypothetical protein
MIVVAPSARIDGYFTSRISGDMNSDRSSLAPQPADQFLTMSNCRPVPRPTAKRSVEISGRTEKDLLDHCQKRIRMCDFAVVVSKELG